MQVIQSNHQKMFCELKMNKQLSTPQLIFKQEALKKIWERENKNPQQLNNFSYYRKGKKIKKWKICKSRGIWSKKDPGQSKAEGSLLAGAGGVFPQHCEPLGKELLRLHGESCLADFQLSSFPHSMAVPAAFMQGCTLAQKRAVLFR